MTLSTENLNDQETKPEPESEWCFPNYNFHSYNTNLDRFLLLNNEIINFRSISYIQIVDFITEEQGATIRIVMNDKITYELHFKSHTEARDIIHEIQHCLKYNSEKNLMRIQF